MSITKPTRALARGLKVIQVLNERHRTPLSLLSERTGMSRATLLRILNTLDAAGWIYRYRADSHYRLSSKICCLGQHLLTIDRLTESAAPVMDRLYAQLELPSDLAVRKGRAMQILESTRRAHPEMGSRSLLNEHFPMLWSAPGRAYLAFCPAAECEAILDGLRDSPEHPDQAIHDHRWVEDLLEETRARGYGLAESGCAIAVPVKTNGQIRACLSLVLIEREDDPVSMAGERLPVLLAAAQEIADSLRRHEAGDTP